MASAFGDGPWSCGSGLCPGVKDSACTYYHINKAVDDFRKSGYGQWLITCEVPWALSRRGIEDKIVKLEFIGGDWRTIINGEVAPQCPINGRPYH